MKPVIIIGTDVEARIAAEICRMHNHVVYGFLAIKREPLPPDINEVPVLGDLEDPSLRRTLQDEKVEFAIAIGDSKRRKDLLDRLFKLTGRLPMNLIHPSAQVSVHGVLTSGLLIAANVVIGPNCEIGPLTYIGAGATLDADVTTGKCCTIGAGAHLGVDVELADDVFIGIGAVVASGLDVDADAVVAPGAVVLRNVDEGQSVAGNPAAVVSVKKAE